MANVKSYGIYISWQRYVKKIMHDLGFSVAKTITLYLAGNDIVI